MSKSNLCTHGPYTWSYDTVIKQVLPGGLTLGNISWYTWATTRHQMKSGCRKCDVQLDHVPKDTIDLLEYAATRGLVFAHDGKWYTPDQASLFTQPWTMARATPTIRIE